MDKVLIIWTLLFLYLDPVQAQDKYVKFIQNSAIGDKPFVFYAGEVLPFVKSKNADEIDIIPSTDTVRNIPSPSYIWTKCLYPNLDHLANAASLVMAGKDYIIVDADTVEAKDALKLISETGRMVIQLKGGSLDSVKKTDVGSLARLIITNSPTIYYITNKLQAYLPPAALEDKNEANDINENNDKPEKYKYLTAYLMTGFVAVNIAFGIFWRNRKRNVIKLKSDPVSRANLGDSLFTPGMNLKIIQPMNPYEMGIFDSTKVLNNDVSLNEFELLKSEVMIFQTRREQSLAELTKIKEKLINVDSLTGYCEIVLSCLQLCNKVLADAYDYFDRVDQKNSKQEIATGSLLLWFQKNIRPIPVDNWAQIVEDIKETNFTSNEKITNSFSRYANNEERIKDFHMLLFDNVLVKYSSCVLILAEAFKNLKYFKISTPLSNSAKKVFSRHGMELRKAITLIRIENKHVPLFSNFELHVGHVETVNDERNIPYKGIRALEKDTIAEIVSYGVST